MATPRRFAIPQDCLSCSLRRDWDFCSLSPDLLLELNAVGNVALFPANALLLPEGQVPRGAYVVCSGRVKLSVETREGKTVILKVAGERDVLGLSALVSGRPSPVTVTTIEACQIKFIEQDIFLELLESRGELALAAARLLAREVGSAFEDVYDLLLARSSTEKLARLLLSWVEEEPHNRDLRVVADFTHEEMAQMIGSSRETVTRLLSDLKRKELIRREGSTLVIPNRIALQAIAS